jgi:hypothetical protein
MPPADDDYRNAPSDLRFWSPRSDSNRRPSDYESDSPRRPGRLQTDLGCSGWMLRRSRRLQTDPDGSRRIVWMIIGMIKRIRHKIG